MRELQILSPDGKTRVVPLEGERLALGRSTSVELSYPEDNGLSRQHLAFEREGDGWAILDLGSKNGTMVNGARIVERTTLKPGDRVVAGHLILLYDSEAVHAKQPVVYFDPDAVTPANSGTATVITSLEGLMKASGQAGAAEAQKANAQLSALIRAGNELAGDTPLNELFPRILDLAIEAVKAHRGVLLTLEAGELVAKANRGEGFHISSAVRDSVLNSGHSVLVKDTSADDALRERRSIVEQNVRSLMAVPLQTKDQVIGIIYVDSPSLVREFTKDDLDLLTVMANVAAIRIEHARLAEVEAARKVMARDLEQAAVIQQSFLPAEAPKVPGLDLAGHNAACRTVGGDYYDFLPMEGGKVGMVLGDVSGKGMPASLLMMGLQARLHVLIERPGSVAELITSLNRATSASCPPGRFITLFFCVVDGATGELTFCNAGHNPPVLVRADGSREQLKGGGPVLGILAAFPYTETTIRLNEGDALVIYSDGVTEATDAAGEEFQTERLGDVIAAHRQSPAREIITAINRAVDEYTGGMPAADDITVVVARRIAT